MEFLALESLPLFAATAALGMIGNTLLVILGLGLVIFFHELGHFAVAKWCDVHVERFSIGIGPILWSRQKGETEYAFSALPFGGYVKMLGQDDMDPNQMTSDEIAENPRSYSAKKVWQRMLIISAGVTMNVITGFLFFAIAYRMGVLEVSPVVGYLHPGDPAWTAGIQPGDRLEAINGSRVRNFTDITQAIVLADGDITIDVRRGGSDEVSLTMTPRQGEKVQMVGIGPARTTRISNLLPEDIPVMSPGMPAARASEPFQRGDRIVAVNGQAVTLDEEVTQIEARLSSEELVYTVERSGAGEAVAAGDDSVERLEITVPAQPVRSIGLWMAIGPVKAIIRGSNAEQAGLLVNDHITRVDDLAVGKDIDPLTLPNYFAAKAGQEVAVTVTRQVGGPGGETEKVLMIEATDAPGWSQSLVNKSTPLPIPAIGAAIQIQRRIAKIIEGSEAARSGSFEVGQQIAKVALERPDSESKDIQADYLGDKPSPFVIDFEKADEEDEDTEQMNWAYAFATLQNVPLRNVRLYPGKKTDGEDGGSVLLTGHEPDKDWYLSQRGINGFEALSDTRKAASWGEALGLGVGYTRSSAINIYLTLNSLFRGRLSPKALSGPVGIVNIGYKVADRGLAQLLMFLGFLSINLAVLNFLPIPILDGGHMFFLIWEGVTRRKPSPRVINWAHGMGLIFIVMLFVFVLYVDFSNLLGFG